MKMQLGKLGKIVGAGALASLMMGATIGFATLDAYPSPFVTSAGVQSLIVVGSGGTDAAGLASDVAGAIDVAARLGGQVTTDVTVAGATTQLSISGEGKVISTTNKRIFLNDTLGKTGLRNTMTKDDLPTLLKDGSLVDSDAGTTHKYTQYIKLSPASNATRNNYALQFEKPGDSSVSNEDPTYSFGEFPSSATTTEFFYQTQIIFDKEVNGTTAVGEKLNLFGGEYTINSDTTFVAGGTSNKLVLSGGSESKVMQAGETASVTIGTTTYEVTMVGTSSSTQAVVKVGTDQKTITKGVQTQIGGLDVYVDDVFHLSTTDLTQNSAKLLLGANKIVLQHGSTVKTGTDETTVQGTFVMLSVSSGKLASFTIYNAGKSSSLDSLKLGSSYSDPVWKNFNVGFPSISEDMKASSRGLLKMEASGDNLATLQFTDDKAQTKSINWAHKNATTDTSFTLADSSSRSIKTLEGTPIMQNQYFVVDAGDFSHLYQVSSMSITSDASSYIDILDMFSGATTRINIGIDNSEEKIIDGQTYYMYGDRATSAMKVWYGAGAANNSVGTYTTIFPKIKGQKGEYLALTEPVTFTLANGTTLQLPTGALSVLQVSGGVESTWTFTATTNEDGTSSVGTSLPSSTNLTGALSAGDTFTLGKTANGGLVYQINGTANTAAVLRIVGGSGTTALTQPALVLVEEEDDNKDIYTITTSLSTEASGSNQQASVSTISFSDPLATTEISLGSDSNNKNLVDRYGTFSYHTTSSQDKIWIYYPDLQISANIAVLEKDATTSSGGTSSGTTIKQAVPIKTSIAKLDSEVTSADKSNKNLILVGGPAVNSLVADLAAAGKTWTRDQYVSQGAGTAILNLVADAFTTGKSALVVAGHSAADTRLVSGILQNYDDHASELAGKNLAVWKNGVISSSLSA